MSNPFGPGYPPLRFAPALRAASRWSAWLLSLLQPAPLGYSPCRAEITPKTTQTPGQPTASRAARPSGRAARPAPPNPCPGPGRRFAASRPCFIGGSGSVSPPEPPTTRRLLLRCTSPRPSPHRTPTADSSASTQTPAHRTAATQPGQPPTNSSPRQAARRPHPSQPPRCRPSLSFPALPPRRCATSIRRFVPALLTPYACCALVASVIAAPSRPSPHRTDSVATTATREAPQRQSAAPPPGRARPEKASRHPPAPSDSVAGRRPKKPAARE